MELSDIIKELQKKREEVNVERSKIQAELMALRALNAKSEELEERSLSLSAAISRLELIENSTPLIDVPAVDTWGVIEDVK